MKSALLFLRRPAVLDTGLALLLGALSLLAVWQLLFPDAGVERKMEYFFGSPQALRWRTLGWLAVIAVELAVVPLRRRFAVPVLLVTLVLATVHSALLPLTPAPADVVVAVAVYSVAGSLPRVRSACLVVACLVAVVGVDTLVSTAGTATASVFWPVKPTSLIVPVLVLGAAWIAGDGSRTRRAFLAEVERRALDAERDRDRRAELAAAAERERITRELHDIVAHALSVMVIQAQGAGAALRRQRAAQADEALEAIVVTGRGALAETRRVLGVIRAIDDQCADPELAPQPCLGDLALLADAVRRAGTPVDLRVTGQIRPLPPGIELSAYRIIQEALTNTMRHAGPGATAQVRVVYSVSDLLLDVSDNGQSERTVGSRVAVPGSGRVGHGLAGMRAWVAMLDGSLSAGRDPAGGFRVRARLPLPAPVAPADTPGAGPLLAERGGP